MDPMVQKLRDTGVIPVIALEEETQALPLAQALLEGGIPAAEVTFRTAAAPGAIRRMAKAHPEMLVCAGTVLTVDQAKEAVDCGAQAIISPGTNPKVVEWCLRENVPVYPGVATPTEVEAALALGLTTLKLFPAQVVGGVSMLKALYGPYRQVKFMPTGGISPANLGDYLTQPNVVACGGSWLCPKELLAAGNWQKIAGLAKACADLVYVLRSQ